MKRTILAVAAVLAMAACGGSSKDPRPAVESLYSIGASVTCDGATVRQSEDGNVMTCLWSNVTLAVVDQCRVLGWFVRADASSPWTLVGLFGDGGVCQPL